MLPIFYSYLLGFSKGTGDRRGVPLATAQMFFNLMT
jgi:hypothetical protein